MHKGVGSQMELTPVGVVVVASVPVGNSSRWAVVGSERPTVQAPNLKDATVAATAVPSLFGGLRTLVNLLTHILAYDQFIKTVLA